MGTLEIRRRNVESIVTNKTTFLIMSRHRTLTTYWCEIWEIRVQFYGWIIYILVLWQTQCCDVEKRHFDLVMLKGLQHKSARPVMCDRIFVVG